MTNSQIADVLEQLADLLEFQGANAFRIRAYRAGARRIRDLPESIATIVTEDPSQLTTLEGIGKGVAEKCITLVTTGELPQLQELLTEIPSTVLDILRVPGMGPRKAAMLYQELQVENLEQLQAACEAGQVQQLKGFGAKTEQTILAGIAIAEAANQRIYWSVADQVVDQLREHLAGCAAIERMEMAGSYRRGRETVGDLDILVVSEKALEVMDQLALFDHIEEVIARGDTKMSIRLADGLQVDLRVVASESFGAALQYFTGSKDHNVQLRSLARQSNLKINEYGVFRVDEDGSETYLAGKDEKEVYAALDLPLFPPELREARREFQWAEEGELPQLVELDALRGDLHMHTTASDGKATLEEMAQAAIERGLDYIAITDHSQRVTMAGGLDARRLRAQWKEIDKLNDQLEGKLLVLKGIECDILEAGGMDLPDDVLAEADWVIASVHYGQRQSRDQITSRIVGAIENSHVSIVAHPTGRLVNRREPYEVDMQAVMEAAARTGTLLELNANPARLDLHDVHCAAARQHGIPIVISSDAHSIVGLDVMRYGILQARRGGLTAADVANTRSWSKLQELIGC
ncbi:MAG: DNA polymerase/3'-5' exonuclease PolX [Planctomycetota bacterium]|nr:DNA polymerase/3'-5' exonuclease PolX [Planctomycetota bacterium]